MPSDPRRKFFLKKDILIVAAILAAAAALYFFGGTASGGKSTVKAEIYYDSKLIKTVTLSPGLYDKFAVPGQPNVVLEVSDGKIRFLESTCHDKICINEGYLSRPGQMAACLPNRVAVKIAGGDASDRADTYIG